MTKDKHKEVSRLGWSQGAYIVTCLMCASPTQRGGGDHPRGLWVHPTDCPAPALPILSGVRGLLVPPPA